MPPDFFPITEHGTSLTFYCVNTLAKNIFNTLALSLSEKHSCPASSFKVIIPQAFFILDCTYLHKFLGLLLLSSAKFFYHVFFLHVL